MPGPTLHRAVAASALTDLLDGTEQPAIVLSARVGAIVVRVDAGAEPRCVCLLAHGLTRLPNGVHTDPTGLPDPPNAGVQISVGAGQIRFGNRALTVVRRWDSRVRPIEVSVGGLAALARATRAAVVGVPGGPVARLAAALTATAADPAFDALPDAVQSLVGLGHGLTPGGDDVLAGTCVGLRAGGRADLVDRLAPGLADVGDRTTALSADLLRLAVSGHACGEAMRVLGALHAVARDPVRLPALTSLVQGLIAVGHTSGAELTTGLLLGLQVAAPGRSTLSGPSVGSSSRKQCGAEQET